MALKLPARVAGFDVESTGLDPTTGDRVIELAVLILDIKSEKIVYSYEQRFDPKCPIHPKAQAVHGISYSELDGKPLFPTAIPTINKIAKASPVWLAHNAQFDVKFVGAEFGLAHEPLPEIVVLDSMDARWATANGKSPSLRELCFALGVDYDPAKAHAALYDVQVMLMAWLQGFKRGFFTHPSGTYEEITGTGE